ncbi:MAG: GumC family protein [Desulfococcaceae bacterium]
MDEKIDILPKIDYYVKLVLKKRWLMIIPFCISMIAGIYLSATLPKIYKADTLIIVEPKSVPDKFVPSIYPQDPQEQIITIEQQIKSRSNIEKLMEEFKIFSGAEHTHMFMEDKIELVRKRIMLKVNKTRSGIESFRIEYEDKDPEKVMKVANWLSGTFIDESVKLRELQVFETNKFLTEELASLRDRLKEIESSIKEYRKEHYGQLPEELASNLAALERLQLQLSEKQQNIRDAKNRLVMLESQINSTANSTPDSFDLSELMEETDEAEASGDSDSPSGLGQLRDTLKNLELRYTEKHPDIVKLRITIAKLEAEEAEKQKEKKDGNAEEEPAEDEQLEAVFENSQLSSPLILQQNEIKSEIIRYVEENNSIQDHIQKYEKRIEMTPKVEQELIDLNRNYINLQRTYNNLLDKKLESDISMNMEKKQKGEKFRVVDTAKIPQKPVSPNMKILFAICLAAGLGIGAGIIFFFDFMDNTLKIPEDISSKLHVPMLAAIPEIQETKHLIFHRMNQVFTAFSLILAFGLFSIFGLFALKGVDRVLEFVKKFV